MKKIIINFFLLITIICCSNANPDGIYYTEIVLENSNKEFYYINFSTKHAGNEENLISVTYMGHTKTIKLDEKATKEFQNFILNNWSNLNEENTESVQILGRITLADSKKVYFLKSENNKPKNWGMLVKYLNKLTNNIIEL